MVLFALPAILGAKAILALIATSAIAPIASELLRRPVGDATEGLVLTEEIPARTAMRMYIEGVMTREQFVETMQKHNMRGDHQAVLLAYSDKVIAEDAGKPALKERDLVLKQIERTADELGDVDDREASGGLKDLDQELDALAKAAAKLASDEGEFEIEFDIDGREFEQRFLEKQIRTPKPVAEPEEIKIDPITYTDFKGLLMRLVPVAVGEILLRGEPVAIDGVIAELKKGLPETGILTAEQLTFAEEHKFYERARPDIFEVIEVPA